MREGGKDFRTGSPITAQVFEDERMDTHHIFPQKWCKAQQIQSKVFDSVINKTAISARTNRMIGGKAPGQYLFDIERRAGISAGELDTSLATHLIDATLLRENKFSEFIAARRTKLLVLISEATGKAIGPARVELEPIDETEEDVGVDDEDLVEEAA